MLTNFVLLRDHYPFIAFKKVERKQYIRKNDGYFKPFLAYVAGLLEQSLTAYLQGIKGKEKDKPEEQLLPLVEL